MRHLATAILALDAALALPAAAETVCERGWFEERGYIACRPDIEEVELRLVVREGDGMTLGEAVATTGGKQVVFAMNAGMWTASPPFRPLGLFVADGVAETPLETRSAAGGNFFLKPNGVFLVEDGRAAVVTTEDYAEGNIEPDLATQSGPMLVIDGAIHPRIILPSGDSEKIRNAVGVTAAGDPVFVITEDRVSFGWLARLYRDALDCPDALYLDGSVSRIHAPEVGVLAPYGRLGPILLAVGRDRNPAAVRQD